MRRGPKHERLNIIFNFTGIYKGKGQIAVTLRMMSVDATPVIVIIYININIETQFLG